MDALDLAMVILASLLTACFGVLVVCMVQLRRIEKAFVFTPSQPSPAVPPRPVIAEAQKRKPVVNDDERCVILEHKQAAKKNKPIY